jgi:hypothetical protein
MVTLKAERGPVEIPDDLAPGAMMMSAMDGKILAVPPI